jgi:hypothetical protein
MSVADILAAARAEKGGTSGAAPAPVTNQSVKQEAESVKTVIQKPPAAPAAAKEQPGKVQAAPPKVASSPPSREEFDRAAMSLDDILAWCRKHDARK